MTQYRNLNYGDRLPASFSDALEQFISTLLVNFNLSLANPTTLQIVAGADNAQVAGGINGRWRWITATVTAAHPGGAAGSYPVFITASDNVFTPSGAPPGSDPENDTTNYNFGLVIEPIAGVPGTALYRQVANVTWDGAKITRITPTTGSLPLNISDLIAVAPESAARNTMTPTADFIMQTFKRLTGQTADMTRWVDESNAFLASVDVHGTMKSASGFMLPSLTLSAINALPAGSRPAALVVFNSDSALAYINIGSDATPNWRPVGRLASDVNQAGTLAGRPAATAVDTGTTYLATDANGGTTFRSNGTIWVQSGAPVNQASLTSLVGTYVARPTPASVIAGVHYLARDANGGTEYRSDGSAAWEQVGLRAGVLHPAQVAALMWCEGVSASALPDAAASPIQTDPQLALKVGLTGGFVLSIQPGYAMVMGDDDNQQGLYFALQAAAAALTLATHAPVTNPRIDAIIARYNDPEHVVRTPYGFGFEQAVGTEVAGATLVNLNGAPGKAGGPTFPPSALLLAYVLWATTDVSGPSGANIQDARILSGPTVWGEDGKRYRIGVDASGAHGLHQVYP